MSVLIACEFSGRVRDVFIKRNHNAISCDLIDTKKPGPHEICKKAGLKSLAELSEITKVSIQTLNNWFKNKRVLFNIVVLGAKSQKLAKKE